MNEYVFYVNLCGGHADGTYTVKADDYSAAYDKALEEIGTKLYAAFPKLKINYDIVAVYDYSEE